MNNKSCIVTCKIIVDSPAPNVTNTPLSGSVAIAAAAAAANTNTAENEQR